MEAFDDIGTGHLKEVFLFEFLEDCCFYFDELVGHEEGEEGV